MNQSHSSQTDTNGLSDTVSDAVKEALRISLRGCDELLPQADWIKKLIKSEATKTPQTHEAIAAWIARRTRKQLDVLALRHDIPLHTLQK